MVLQASFIKVKLDRKMHRITSKHLALVLFFFKGDEMNNSKSRHCDFIGILSDSSPSDNAPRTLQTGFTASVLQNNMFRIPASEITSHHRSVEQFAPW